MKKILLALLVSLPLLSQAQIFTPNLNLQLPPQGTTNWTGIVNGNFTKLDSALGILQNPFMGNWNVGTSYSKAQIVTRLGAVYISLINGNLAFDPSTSPAQWQIMLTTANPHSILSSVHSDTTVASILRGDGFFAVGATPTWQRVPHSTATGGYFKWNGVDIVPSSLAAAGVGTCAGGQFVTALNGDATPTCNAVTFADGSAASPGIPFTNEVSTGFWRRTTSRIDVSLAGTTGIEWDGANKATRIGSGWVYGWSSNTDPTVTGADTALSRDSANVVDVGNGTQGDKTGRTNQNTVGLYTTSNTLPATVSNDTAGGILIVTNAGKGWQVNNSTGQLQGFEGATVLMQGSTSGSTVLQPSATASGTLTLPAATDQLIARATTDTLTNKRVTQRVVTLSSSTTFTPDGDNSDMTYMNMTGVAGTLTIAAPTGTPTDGQKLILRIKTTNAQTYSFNATYRFSTTTTAPTTLAAGKTDYIGLIWTAVDSKWDVVAVDQGH